MFYLTGSDGAFTRTPDSTTLIPGTLLRLNCGTTLPPAEWSFVAPESTSSVDMTSFGVLTSTFTPYFYIDTSHQYDLVAHTSNADESYCGTYRCTGGGGDSRTATVASKCTCI